MKQWITSWTERGNDQTPAKRLVAYLDEYDLILEFSTLQGESYKPDAAFKVALTPQNVVKLTQGLFNRATTIKSKIFVKEGQTIPIVLTDLLCPIFTANSVNALRIVSTNTIKDNGKPERHTYLSYYEFPSYDSYKTETQKQVEKNTVLKIDDQYRKAFIKLNAMPITNGSYIYNDVATLENIGEVISTLHSAKILECGTSYYKNLRDKPAETEVINTKSTTTVHVSDSNDDDFPF